MRGETSVVSTASWALPTTAGHWQCYAAVAVAIRVHIQVPEQWYRSNRCRLTVLALEIGERWSAEATTFVRLLARCRARSAPPPSRAAAISA